MAPGGPRSSTANTPTAPTLTKLFEVESLDPLPEGSQPSPIETAVPNVCGPAGLPVDRYLSIPSESGPTPDPPRRMLVSPDGNTVFPMRPGPLPENSSSYYRNPDGAAWARISGKKKGFRYASGGALARMTGGSGEKQLQFCRMPGGDGLTGTAVYAYETNQVLQNHCQGKTGLIRAIGNVSAEDAITLARMGAMKPGKLFLAADGRQVPYTNLSEQQYCVLDPVTRADGQREYPFFMVPDLSTVQGLAGAVEASGLFGDRGQGIAAALQAAVVVESQQVSAMKTQIEGLKEQLAALKKQLWIMAGFMLFTGASLYFMAREKGWTKPVDPYIDGFFRWTWEKMGIRYQVDFVRKITPEMVKDGTVRRALGREADYRRLDEQFGLRRNRVITVVERAGGGKTFFLNGVAVEIYEGRMPEFDPNKTDVYTLDLGKLIGHHDNKYVSVLQARWQDFVEQVEATAKGGRVAVVLIDEIHRLAGMGATEGGGANDLGNQAKSKLTEWENNPNIRLVAATTKAEYPQLVANPQTGQRDEAQARRYPEFELEPITPETLRMIVDGTANEWEVGARAKGKTLTITPEGRERAIELGFHQKVELANPDAALTILDEAQARAVKRSLPGGVTRALVDEVFAEHYKVSVAEVRTWRYDPAAVAATPAAPPAPAVVLPSRENIYGSSSGLRALEGAIRDIVFSNLWIPSDSADPQLSDFQGRFLRDVVEGILRNVRTQNVPVFDSSGRVSQQFVERVQMIVRAKVAAESGELKRRFGQARVQMVLRIADSRLADSTYLTSVLGRYFSDGAGSLPPPAAPSAPVPGSGGGNGSGVPHVVTTGWESVLTQPVDVSQQALLDSLRADPASRPLADFYEEQIGVRGRVETMSDLVNRLPPEVAATALAELHAQGVLDVSQVPEKAIFRLVAGAAKATGAWVDGNPLEVVRLETRFESEMRVRRGVGRSDGTGRAGAPHEEDPSRRRSRSKGRGAARLPAGRP